MIKVYNRLSKSGDKDFHLCKFAPKNIKQEPWKKFIQDMYPSNLKNSDFAPLFKAFMNIKLNDKHFIYRKS